MREKMARLFKTNTSSTRAVWFTVGLLLARGVSILTAPIFTRYLTVQQFGEFSLFAVWATILVLICSLYTYGSYPVAHARLDGAGWRSYQSNAFALSTLSFAVWFCIIWWFPGAMSALTQVRADLLPLLVGYSFAMFVTNSFLTALAQEKKQQAYFVLSLLLMLSTIGLSVWLVLRTPNPLMGRVHGVALPYGAFAIVLYMLVMWRGKSVANKRHWRFALSVSLPMIFQAMFFMLPAQSNRMMLTAYGQDGAAGIYSLAYIFGAVPEDIIVSFNLSWVPAYFEHLTAARHDLAEAQGRRFAQSIALLVMGFLLVSPEAYRLLADASYWNGVPMMALVALAGYIRFVALFPLNYALYSKKTGWTALASVCALAVNIGGNALLIPRMGGMGVAVSTVLAYFTLLAILWVTMRCAFPMPHRVYAGWGILPVAACAGLCLWLPQAWLLRWALAAIVGGLLLRQMVRHRGFF